MFICKSTVFFFFVFSFFSTWLACCVHTCFLSPSLYRVSFFPPPCLGYIRSAVPVIIKFFFLSLSLRVECDLISASYLPAPPFFLYNNNKCYIALNSATLVRIITIKREKNWFKPTTTIYLFKKKTKKLCVWCVCLVIGIGRTFSVCQYYTLYRARNFWNWKVVHTHNGLHQPGQLLC